ncbi:hypothetical protein C8J57DRAFT_1228349 [Mycena rebaudengoi]|nr:hypothetical protein C8J57DRAFT_1228349 [Mycena rebaudengoi]
MALRAFPTGNVRVTVLSPLKLTVVALSKIFTAIGGPSGNFLTWYLSRYQEVDEGSNEDDAIDVEAWTTLSEAPGSWTANDEDTAVPSSSEVWAKAGAANVDIFRCCICFSMPNKPVINLGIQNCCPVCRAIYEAPIRDNTYKMELSDAVREGLVEPSACDTPEKLYDWDGVVFTTLSPN